MNFKKSRPNWKTKLKKSLPWNNCSERWAAEQTVAKSQNYPIANQPMENPDI